MGIVLLHEGVDFADQFLDVGERAATDGLLCDEPEQALDLVDPGGIGGRVMHVVSGTASQPGVDLGVFVGSVVVDDEMDIEVLGHVGVDVAQEGEELLVPMASLALCEHLACGHVQGGEQRGGAVADIIVRDAFDIAQSHGQHRLGALQGLDLAFFVHAQHHGMIGRVQVQPDDVADFFDEEGVIGEFEVALAVRLDAEQIEPALHGGLGDAGVFGHGSHAPVRGVGRLGPKGGVDDLGDALVLVAAGPSGAQLVVQAFQAALEVAPAPFADGHVVQPHAFGDVGVGLAFGRRRARSGPAAPPREAVSGSERC